MGRNRTQIGLNKTNWTEKKWRADTDTDTDADTDTDDDDDDDDDDDANTNTDAERQNTYWRAKARTLNKKARHNTNTSTNWRAKARALNRKTRHNTNSSTNWRAEARARDGHGWQNTIRTKTQKECRHTLSIIGMAVRLGFVTSLPDGWRQAWLINLPNNRV